MNTQENINAFIKYIETYSLDINKIIKAYQQYEINLDNLTEKQIIIILANLNDYKHIKNKSDSNKLDIQIIEWEFEHLQLSNIIKSDILHNSILTNNLEIVEYLSNTDLHCKHILENIDFNIFAKVCSYGYLDMTKFLINYQQKIINIDNNINRHSTHNLSLIQQPKDYNDIIILVSRKGYLDVLIYIIEISNKFNKDYYRHLLKEHIIKESLINNHPHITKWIIETWQLEYNYFISILISIFQECIINNSINSVIFIYNFISSTNQLSLFDNVLNNNSLHILKEKALNIFNIYNIKLNLVILQYLFDTFIKNDNINYLEQNDHELIKKIFKTIKYSYCNNKIIKDKINWIVSLSDKYEIIFDENNIPKLTILNPIIIAIRNNNIIEACQLLGIKKINLLNLHNSIISLECNVCLDNKYYSIITTCNHYFCLNCIYEWLIINTHTICPYCRQHIVLETSTYYIHNKYIQ